MFLSPEIDQGWMQKKRQFSNDLLKWLHPSIPFESIKAEIPCWAGAFTWLSNWLLAFSRSQPLWSKTSVSSPPWEKNPPNPPQGLPLRWLHQKTKSWRLWASPKNQHPKKQLNIHFQLGGLEKWRNLGSSFLPLRRSGPLTSSSLPDSTLWSDVLLLKIWVNHSDSPRDTTLSHWLLKHFERDVASSWHATDSTSGPIIYSLEWARMAQPRGQSTKLSRMAVMRQEWYQESEEELPWSMVFLTLV